MQTLMSSSPRTRRSAWRQLLAGFVALSLGAALAQAAQPQGVQVGDLRVEQAWSRATLAGQRVGGGYLTVVNTGSQADRLVGASAPVSPTVEMHTMSMENNVMRMREVAHIDVPAGGTVTLAPGGLHLMFMGLPQALTEGQTFPLTLRFERAGEVTVPVQVRASDGAGGHGGGHGGHGAGHGSSPQGSAPAHGGGHSGHGSGHRRH